jgi:tetratricopeptide (TPR) repeat protein
MSVHSANAQTSGLEAQQLASNPEAVALNDDGVASIKRIQDKPAYAKTLKDSDWQAIFDKFQTALDIDPQFDAARKNLAIALSNFALCVGPAKALRQFHQALYIDDSNPTTIGNMNVLLRKIGMDPSSFADRVKLGDQAKLNKDLPSAVIEYRAALKLKNDPQIHKKLGDVYRQLYQEDKAVAEYAAAGRDSK